MEEVKCMGCGVMLQTEDENKIGYTTEAALERDHILCKRCYRLKHYNEIVDVTMDNEDFVRILTQIGAEDALVVKVIDLFDLTGSIVSGMLRLIGYNDMILVGNKRDLLPKAVKDTKIINWVRRSIKEFGLKVVDCCLTSSTKGHGINELLEIIEEHRKGRDVYIVGCTNVGKSTLVNAIIKRYTDKTEDVITISHYPGTTLGLIEIPLDSKSFLIDTPGIINPLQYSHYLHKKNIKYLLPKKEIKPKIYQLQAKQSLFISGFARFDFVSGEDASFVCFFNNDLKIHRTKLQNADDLFLKHKGELLSPPSHEELENLGEFKKHRFKTPNYKCDLVICGLGFITIDQPYLQITVHAPKQIGVFIRHSLL